MSTVTQIHYEFYKLQIEIDELKRQLAETKTRPSSPEKLAELKEIEFEARVIDHKRGWLMGSYTLSLTSKELYTNG